MQKIGKYEIVRRLGDGATSTVYLARDPFAMREVAVKLVSRHALDDPRASRVLQHLFLTEASLVGKLEHPHIAAIYDAVTGDEAMYVVMEYVPGGTLEQYARADRLLPVDEVVDAIYKCSRALDFALRLGLVHRDIKPENILVAGGTDVKVSDFGAAAMMTGTRTVLDHVGTPAYMSPEQHRNEPATCQTDIYALGVVMFELLTGRRPFKAANIASLAHQVLNETAPEPSRFRSVIPPAVDRLVSRALERDCAKRYQNWQAFSEDLVAAAASPGGMPRERVLDAEKFGALRKLSFFAAFADADLWEVARSGEWRQAAAGEVVVHEGAASDNCYVLVSGSAEVRRNGQLLSVLQAGECCGEMVHLGRDNIRHACVIATAAVTVLGMPVSALARATDLCRLRFDRAVLAGHRGAARPRERAPCRGVNPDASWCGRSSSATVIS